MLTLFSIMPEMRSLLFSKCGIHLIVAVRTVKGMICTKQPVYIIYTDELFAVIKQRKLI